MKKLVLLMAMVAPVDIQIPNAPETLDCHTYYAKSTQCILRNMYSGLYKISKDGKAELDIAKEAKKISKKKWEITLRGDAKWSNGEKITALDFVSSWNRPFEA